MPTTSRPFWRSIENWLTWGLLAALLLCAISAVEAARWVGGHILTIKVPAHCEAAHV